MLRRRKQLVEAGLEVFGTRGFHGSGVRDICAQAGLTERYFYESFSNREALFLAVYDEAVERVRTRIVSALEHAQGGEVIESARAGLRAYLETISADPRLARITLVDVFTVGVEVGMQSIAATRSFADLVDNLVRRIHSNALESRGLQGLNLAEGLVGSTVFIVVQWASSGFQEPLERILAHCLLFYEVIAANLVQTDPVSR